MLINCYFMLILIVGFLKEGNFGRVKRATNIDGMCINTRDDEYLVGTFLKQFNETYKFTDLNFDVLNKLNTSIWYKRRITKPNEPYKMDASSRLVIPERMVSTTFSGFNFTIYNNLRDNYDVYWIDWSGKAVWFSNLKVGYLYNSFSYVGHIWLLMNANKAKNDVLMFKLGKNPFTVPDTTISISQISENLNDLMLKPFIFVNTNTKTMADPVIPSGILSSKPFGTDFNFTLRNDLSNSYDLYWIDYNGQPNFYFKLIPGSSFNLNAYINNTWFLKNKNINVNEDMVFIVGKAPVITQNGVVLVSDIFLSAKDLFIKPCVFVNEMYASKSDIIVPIGIKSLSGTAFSFTLYNDLGDSYNVIWIDFNGNSKQYATLQPGFYYTLFSEIGHVWYLRNLNMHKNETLYLKIGEIPFVNNNGTVKVSDIVFRIDDIFSINNLQPYTSKQGAVTDCYILQCLISIYAMYPNHIISRFMFPSKLKETGAAIIKLWDKKINCWSAFLIDDVLPVSDTQPFGVTANGLIANEYWVALFEKAFAKIVGSYPDLEGALGLIQMKDVHEMLMGPIDYLVISMPKFNDGYAVFNRFLNYYKNGAIISFITKPSNLVFDPITGIVSDHGYGLLNVQENVANSGFTLIKCQNTWSIGDGEWIGDWSDYSSLWNEYPDIKKELNFEKKNDGEFWIEKKDFYKAFTSFVVAIPRQTLN